MTAYADAVESRQPATKNLYFDVTQLELVLRGRDESLKKAAALMRRIGLRRILWGSDEPEEIRDVPRNAWNEFRGTLPMTDREFVTIARNVAPFLR